MLHPRPAWVDILKRPFLAVASLVFWNLMAVSGVRANTFETLYSSSSTGDISSLVIGNDGLLYGTTAEGGTNDLGTVFKISLNGTRTVIHNFSLMQGSIPLGALVRSNDGHFYGTTSQGGKFSYGTIFKITPSGVHSLLHSFNDTDGNAPQARLTRGNDGAYYGTTQTGGGGMNAGVVFKITTSGTYTVLHRFGLIDGSYPYGWLSKGSDGNFYGTTYQGGNQMNGTIYKITPTGNHSVIHSFYLSPSSNPRAGLFLASNGSFYGTTTGTSTLSSGTAFRFTPDGTFSTLHEFIELSGHRPVSGVVEGIDGAFYGTTQLGGTHDNGTIYRITPEGEHSVLHSFAVGDEIYPSSTPIFASDGHLYGTAKGLIWRLKLAMPKIQLKGNSVAIANNSRTPKTTNHTDFGTVSLRGGPVTRTFTIINSGNLPLNLTGMPPVEINGENEEDFAVTEQPAALLEAGESTTFTVRFTPSEAGTRSATVVLPSDAPGVSVFGFSIKATAKEDTKGPLLKLVTPSRSFVSAPSPLLISGIAEDDFAVERVEVTINGNDPIQANLGSNTNPKSKSFSVPVTPIVGENALQITAFDSTGNRNSVAKTFTFEQRYVLSLQRQVPTSILSTPDRAGTLTFKAAVGKHASAPNKGNPSTSGVLPSTGLVVTAKAKTGFLFSHWDNLPFGAEVRGHSVSFTMPTADTAITAVFIDNPFLLGTTASRAGTTSFRGLLRPSGYTAPGNDTVGLLNATLTRANGSLSGKIWMGGKVTTFIAALYGNGTVWFRTGSVMSSKLPFDGRELSITWSEQGLSLSSTRIIESDSQTSVGLAKPPVYSKNHFVRNEWLDSKGGAGHFSIALQAIPQDPELDKTAYPQGTGYARMTLMANGALSVAGVLADGTRITASSFLTTDNTGEVFQVLPTPGGRTKGGSLLGTLVVDESQDESDVVSYDFQWFRPPAQTKIIRVQAYRAGWPNGIYLGLTGSLYNKATLLQSALGLGLPDAQGNVLLTLREGKLVEAVHQSLNLEGNKVRKIDPSDQGWSLTFYPNTGLIKGRFTPNWTNSAKKLPIFSGILLHKGLNPNCSGFFLSNRLSDLEPESGSVHLD